MAGALAGDFMQGLVVEDLPAALARGVRLHRAIDRACDAHPAFAELRARLRPGFGHHARVVADVLLDHALARDWARWADVPLAAFTARVYACCEAFDRALPARLRRAWPRMRAGDLLASYRDLGETARALERMGRGRRHGAVLAGARARLAPHAGPAGETLGALLPALEALARAEAGWP